MKKKIPAFRTDREAERFIESADLSAYDLSEFKPVRFEFESKSAQLNMRLPKPLLDAVKTRARNRGMPYTRFIRETLEHVLSAPVNAKPRSGKAKRKSKSATPQTKSR